MSTPEAVAGAIEVLRSRKEKSVHVRMHMPSGAIDAVCTPAQARTVAAAMLQAADDAEGLQPS